MDESQSRNTYYSAAPLRAGLRRPHPEPLTESLADCQRRVVDCWEDSISRALFDEKGRGWCVYEPESGHHPTVTNGEALVLYMLPGGHIEFTDA